MKEGPCFYNKDGSQHVFKQEPSVFDEGTEVLKRAQEFQHKVEIGQREGSWRPKPEYPLLPSVVLFATDIHYGSIRTDYDKLVKHLDMVENTPNFYMITNGDDVDNFNVALGRAATGVYENPLSPQLQTEAWVDRLRKLDAKGKVGAISFGNHNDFSFSSGYEWLQTFCKDMNANVFASGGFLHLLLGEQHYGIGMTHRYWGTSKLNPTNACKRYFDFEAPQADIVFLGHTHQSEMLTFEKGGRERIGLIGGTYKIDDQYARKAGIGGRSGAAGHAIMFFPNEHRMVGFKHIEDAHLLMTSLLDVYAKKGVALLGLTR